MDLNEWEYLQPISESFREPSGLHATNPFARNVGTISHSNAHVENTMDAMIANTFLEVMSDNVSNANQNVELASMSQPESSELPRTAPIQLMALKQRAKATSGLP